VKIAVLVKRVPDTASVFKVAPDGKSVLTDDLKYVISPYDEHAAEEAIRIQEAGGGEVVVISLGGGDTQEILRTVLAMGADRGIHIAPPEGLELGGLGVALVLAAVLKREAPDLVLAGKQAVDGDAAQVPERVAELLEWPHASVVSKLELGAGKATVDREIEGGKYRIELPLPAVLSIEKGINTPRYPKLPNIMKAKKKPLDTVTLEDLGLSADVVRSQAEIAQVASPRTDRRNKIVGGDTAEAAREVVRLLRDEDKAL
jgi:electron transfer flavoprotein beta subunit